MKIAINAMSAVAGGGVTYIKNLLSYLSKMNTNHHFLILTTISGKKTFYFQHPDFTFRSFKIPSKGSILRILWEQCMLPSILKKEGVDILFSPGNVCPLFTATPNVVMVQNIEPFNNELSKGQGLIQRVRLKLLKSLTILSMKRAQRVIFPSMKAHTLAERSGTLIRHAKVIYHGIDKKIFYPRTEDDMSRHWKKKYGLDKFILYVSHIQRYKNFLELIKAFILLKGKVDDNIQLVFAGKCFDRGYYDEMKAFIAGHGYEDRVVFLGNIPYEELPYFYSGCMIFVYPSTCESFGMTLVEAMACGAPILASQMEPMTEVCGDAAVYFDPMNPAAMADTIHTALKDQNQIFAMIKKAQERAKTFSWENTVRYTLEIFGETSDYNR